MLNFNSLLVFSEDPKVLVDFYKKVFQSEPGWTGGDFSGFQVGSGYLVIGPHDKVHGKSTTPERIMFNFETKDVKAEFERIKKLGADVIQDPYHPSEEDENDQEALIATFADPDGNYFQLTSPMKM
jgi:predicted enzyme related to lactoylglutathione lyase